MIVDHDHHRRQQDKTLVTLLSILSTRRRWTIAYFSLGPRRLQAPPGWFLFFGFRVVEKRLEKYQADKRSDSEQTIADRPFIRSQCPRLPPLLLSRSLGAEHHCPYLEVNRLKKEPGSRRSHTP